jgi:monooxygenase
MTDRRAGESEHLDVVIVGAGLSGIGAAWYLQHRLPGRSYAILEARDALGGTWDLFRYPGIRSDSDMYTLGYRFRPWSGERAIADGREILGYVEDTAREHGIDRRIRYGRRVIRASWHGETSRWTLELETAAGDREILTCSFLLGCCGYYRYDQGYRPELPGAERFGGELVHPQHWPAELDCAGRRVIVIGSGATAVTLVPALAAQGARVTMLQRSPSYIISLPAQDALADVMRRHLPARAAYALARAKNVALSTGFYQLSRRRPETVKRLIRRGLERALPEGYPIDAHFTPRYDPWDQRLCMAPDGDLFAAIRDGGAAIVTDEIETLTERGVRLRSGAELEADVIVTATGLNLLAFGGIELEVDGAAVELPRAMAYRAMMLSEVPNFAYAIGYTNASWTLKVDLVWEYVCRLIRHMDQHGYASCRPRYDPTVGEAPFLDFAAGYVQRSLHLFPKQGTRAPWRLRMNYLYDVIALRYGRIDDGTLAFAPPSRP